MTTRICPECTTAFTPSSTRQLFCRPACAHRQRQRNYRHTTPAGPEAKTRIDQSIADNREAMAALTALYEATIRNLRSTHQRKFARITRSFESQLAAAHEQLNERAQAASRAQSKADDMERSMRHLQRENKLRELSERQSIKDMQHLAAKVLTLHSNANMRLDPSTAAIFARRGWNTEMGTS
ncbi:hypothetical protein [Arthrobacter sp. lap29]|uniref:hypothetical protein n=1 Tax=Arthrobacter sp. lap29 TaxID=3056122 RepID=UPI0028F6EF39|nr:hypothetical protein [Arthrobacter sp. lap29]